MAIPLPLSFILFFFFFLSLLASCSSLHDHHQNPDLVAQDVHRSINESRRNLGNILSCGTGNPIDDCWRCDHNWMRNRQRLADCAIGFGRNAFGGRNGRVYIVTDPSDDIPHNPKPGTLRYAVSRHEPLWIIFRSDMLIKLNHALIIKSHKTIDGRGASVHIGFGPCILIHNVSNIIIHGIHVHDCKEDAKSSDGDGITVMSSKHIWIDHLSMSRCYDGLIDVTHGSTGITISNNHFFHHDKVMLLGHNDSFLLDKHMQVTVAFNHFGVGLTQRMPRCRHGYFHVVNNDYYRWGMYAIGGSANPTINSQGNRFHAPDNPNSKQVTKYELAPESVWRHWNWRTEGDLMLNGAYFKESGVGASHIYAKASSLSARPASLVRSLTYAAGALTCRTGFRC